MEADPNEQGEGIDYGPSFEGDVGAILKNRLLMAIDAHRQAEAELAEADRQLTAIGNRWTKATDARDATRVELSRAAGAWETWERQQRQKGPQTRQEAPGSTEGDDATHGKGGDDGEA